MSFHRKLFYILIILLPTQLGFHMWPAWSYILGRKIDYLSPTLYITDILIFGIAAFFLLERKPKIHFSPLYVLVFFFVVANIYFAHNPFVALYAWSKVLEFALVVYYIAKAKVQPTELVFPFSIAVLYSSVIGISQYFLQRSLGGIFWFLGERMFWIDTPGIAKANVCSLWSSSCVLSLRSYATFPHPNVLGGFLAVVLPYIWYMTKQEPVLQTTRRYIWYASIMLGVMCLIVTFSRSAWVIFIISIVVQHIFAKQRNNGYRSSSWYYLLFFVLLGLGLVMVPFSDESIEVRRQLNTAALSIWAATPFWGIGLGNFLFSLPAHLARTQVYFLQPVHNIYLLLLSETGVVGILMICCGFYVVWKKHVRPILMSPMYYAFISILFLGLVDHYPLTLQQGQLLFAVFFGLAYRALMVQ